MWQNIAALVLLIFGVIVAIIGVIFYLQMFRKQRQSQDKAHSTSFDNTSNDEHIS